VAPPDVELSAESPDGMLATWVPANANHKNIVVPMNSPRLATKSTARQSGK
jgi:hypothetical protein